jgi:CRP-like cAMP-binding protein
MQPRTLEELLARHEFFEGLDQSYLDLIAGCGHNVGFDRDAYLFREGEPADEFFIVRRGQLALEIFAPGRGPLVVDTVGEGEVVGISWLFPPHRWEFDGRAVVATRAVALDGACLRGKCEDDPKLGYELMKRFAAILRRRLQSARLRLLDVYGDSYAL